MKIIRTVVAVAAALLLVLGISYLLDYFHAPIVLTVLFGVLLGVIWAWISYADACKQGWKADIARGFSISMVIGMIMIALLTKLLLMHLRSPFSQYDQIYFYSQFILGTFFVMRGVFFFIYPRVGRKPNNSIAC